MANCNFCTLSVGCPGLSHCVHSVDEEVADRKSRLILGKIPAGTVCPFRAICSTAEEGRCWHRGVEHETTYSCALARAFDMLDVKL